MWHGNIVVVTELGLLRLDSNIIYDSYELVVLIETSHLHERLNYYL